MTKLLKASLILASPLLFAYGHNKDDSNDEGSGISISAEIFGGTIDQSFSMLTSTAITASSANAEGAQEQLSQAVIQGYRLAVQEKGDDHPHTYFGGRVVASMDFNEDVKGAVYFSAESAPDDGHFFYQSGIKGAGSDTTTPALGNIKQSTTMVPGVFVMYGGLGLVAEYDMREYEIDKMVASAAPTVEKKKDEQMMFGFRAESDFNVSDMDMHLVAQYTQTFDSKTETDVKDVFAANHDHNFEDAAASTVKISDMYSLVHKAHIGLSFNLTDL